MQGLIRLLFAVVLVIVAGCATTPPPGTLDLAAVRPIPLDKIVWKDSPTGTSATAPLYGDPNKPGPYAFSINGKPAT